MEFMTSLLLEHPSTVKTEYTGKYRITDRDVRQEAAIKVLKSLDKRGVSWYNEDTLIEGLDANGGLIRTSLNSVVRDAIRKDRGYKKEPRPKMLSLTALEDTSSPIADPTAEEALEAVEGGAVEELSSFMASASPAEQEAVIAMKQAQWYVEQGMNLPNDLRSKLKRLRKQTGLALDVSIL